MPAVQVFEQRDAVFEGKLQPVVPALHRTTQFGRQAGDELRVILVDQPVLVAHRVAVRHAHADILVGADDFVGARFYFRQVAGRPALQMLHGGDAGGDHLECRIQRVEIRVDVAHHHAGDEPQFQRHVGRAKLHRRQADMVMAVDEAGQQDFVARAQDRNIRMLAAQIGIGADGGDHAVFLQHRSVRHFVPGVTIGGVGDHRAAADQ